MAAYLFSYGTLQREDVQTKLFGRILNGSPDVLHGYKLLTVEITDKAFLARGEEKYQRTVVVSTDPNDRIDGTALELTEEELNQSDEYEPEGYERVRVKLESGKEAWIYLKVE
jgi:hypothetical protein